jgi:hypothetical protein
MHFPMTDAKGLFLWGNRRMSISPKPLELVLCGLFSLLELHSLPQEGWDMVGWSSLWAGSAGSS